MTTVAIWKGSRELALAPYIFSCPSNADAYSTPDKTEKSAKDLQLIASKIPGPGVEFLPQAV